MIALAAHPFLGLHDTDLIAIGGVSAAIATIILAFISGRQLKQARSQTRAMQGQVMAIRDTARDELETVRLLTRAQFQPLVYPILNSVSSGGGHHEFTYSIWNYGTGPAIDIEHGWTHDGTDHPSDSRRLSLRVDESQSYSVAGEYPGADVIWFARFSNVLNERFETLIPGEDGAAITFRKVDP